MLRRALLLAVCGSLAVASGCGGRASAGAGAAADAGAPAWVPREPLGEADALRAMTAAHDEVWRRLGPHRFEAQSHLKVTVGAAPPDVLDEELVLEAGTAGAYRAFTENSHDLGREVVFVGGDLYLRPRYGTFMRRPPEHGEADRVRAETFGALRAAVDLLGRFVLVRAAGRATVGGRDALRATLALAPQPRPGPAEADPRRQWRATVAVQRLAGTLTVDALSGAPLACTLQADYTFRRGEHDATAELTYAGTLTPGAPVAVTAPAHVPQPFRTRYHVERQQLLEGLVPPGATPP